MNQNPSDLLRAEHREVENHLDTLLYALKHLSHERVREIGQSVENIRGLIGAHMDIEERVFYPAIQALAEHLLPNMLKQHDEIREADRYLGELLSWFPEPPTDRDMGELYRLGIELHDAVQVHIVDEEEHLLKLVDEGLSSEQQRSLLAAMQGGMTAMQQKPDSGRMRQPGPTSSPILEFNLANEIEQLRREEPWRTTGRNAKTMVKHPDFRIVLTVLKASMRVQEHQTVGRISVQTVAGHIRMRVGEDVYDLPQGCLVALDSALPHDVEALEDSAFLITIALPAGR
ncbi:MAG: hemerythrin domain-containing protein [Acidobacteria bacterium]|nr:hemerythrin domain-containing protein [Acidobacteriota bacterium]